MTGVTQAGAKAALQWLGDLKGAPAIDAGFLGRLSTELADVQATNAEFLAVARQAARDLEFYPTPGHLAKMVVALRQSEAAKAQEVAWKARAISGSEEPLATDEQGRSPNGLTYTESLAHIQDLVRRGHEGRYGKQRESYADAIQRELASGERPRYGRDLTAFRNVARGGGR